MNRYLTLTVIFLLGLVVVGLTVNQSGEKSVGRGVIDASGDGFLATSKDAHSQSASQPEAQPIRSGREEGAVHVQPKPQASGAGESIFSLEDNQKLRNPEAFSELIQIDESSSEVSSSLVADQVLAAWSACSLLSEADPSDPTKSDSIARLNEFCDLDTDAASFASSMWSDSGYARTLEAISDDVDFGYRDGALDTVLSTIALASSLGELRAAAAWLVELAFSEEASDAGLLNLQGVSWQGAHSAGQDAVTIYYCQSIGGCPLSHFVTLSLCASMGCDDYVQDAESAIYRATSPRHFELVTEIISYFYRARRA
jgi:hypothetical protein